MKHSMLVIALVIFITQVVAAQTIRYYPSPTFVRYSDVRNLLADSVQTIRNHGDTTFVTAIGKSFFVISHRNANNSGVYYLEGNHIFDSSRVFFIDALPKKDLFTTMAYDKKCSIFGCNAWPYPSAFTFYSGEVNIRASYRGKRPEMVNGQPVFYRTGADLVHCISEGFTSFNADTVNRDLINKVLYSEFNSYVRADTISKKSPIKNFPRKNNSRLKK